MTPEWDENTCWTVQHHEKSVARATGTREVLLLAYDTTRVQREGTCNLGRQNGDLCRMPAGHDGAHVPFSGELVAQTGVYVVDRMEL